MAVQRSKLIKLRGWWEWRQPEPQLPTWLDKAAEPQPPTWLHKAARGLQRRLSDLTVLLLASTVAPLQPDTDTMAAPATKTSLVEKRLQPDVVAPFLPIGVMATETPVPHGELSQPEAQLPAAPHTVASHAAAPMPSHAPKQPPAPRVQHDLPDRAELASVDTEASRDSLDRPTIQRGIQRNSERIRRCYERRMLDQARGPDPDASDRWHVEVRFKIMTNGTVGSTTVTSDDSKLESCVRSVIQKITFPRSRSTVEVVYPFDFFPVQKPIPERSAL